MKRFDVEDIIKKYLEDNGFDGLCNKDCGCLISDLAPCGQPSTTCRPGYKTMRKTYGGNLTWHVVPNKPRKE